MVIIKSDLNVQENRGRFVEQKLMLSSNFRCYQTRNCHRDELGHILLWHLSRTKMFNKPTSQAEAALLNIQVWLK
jgi:hypothetical protein